MHSCTHEPNPLSNVGTTFCKECRSQNYVLLVAAAPSGYFQDNIVTHLVAGLGAGFFAVCVGSPVDVVKSRVMGRYRYSCA